MARRGKRDGLKGQTQKERTSAGIVSSVVVTSLGMHICAADVIPTLVSAFRKTETDESSINSSQAFLGSRVATKKGAFFFLPNVSGDTAIQRMRISAADTNIIVLDKEINPYAENLLRQTRQDNLLFLSCIKDVSGETKKYVKKMFGKQKIYSLTDIGRVLESKTVLNKKRHSRPLMIADSIAQVDSQTVVLTGSLDRGFASHTVLLNGMIQGKITAISTEAGPVDIRALKALTAEEIYGQEPSKHEKAVVDIFNQIRINDNPEEYSDDSLGCINDPETDTDSDQDTENLENLSSDNIEGLENEEGGQSDEEDNEMSEMSDISDISEYETLEASTKKEELTNRYKGFKGFRTINIGEHRQAKENEQMKLFRTQNLPPYYKDLSFIGSERARKKILAKKSPVPVRTPLTITVVFAGGVPALEELVQDGFCCVSGLFDYEGLPSICTLSFNSTESIVPEESPRLLVDYGFMSVVPETLVVGNGTEIIKTKRESASGTLCFIAPLILTEEKVLLVKDSVLIGTGVQSLRKDPILVKTVIFKGTPIKINKRSCVVGRMFRSRAEVKYFKDIKLYSSKRKEGHIKKALGEKGLMKCYFCPAIKHGEKIYMELARRVFIG
ncbi:pre-rRNA-processing protein TSR1 [Nematocida displodere]|uniref:Pre-rRNA-processing protein TSR1 n=1 Tax=Nematocida displodere TaxID=1805483 RepID=A0A177ELD6_9MICR|nr:pre-rRNA-processing protein TSR1 [Nematocida displodere]